MTIEPAPPSPYWFAAKRYGWGWGLPLRWQGWVVLAAFFLLMVVNAMVFTLPGHLLAFLIGTGLLCGALTVVCFWRGEPPAWRWGG
jgi:hypothetical protein